MLHFVFRQVQESRHTVHSRCILDNQHIKNINMKCVKMTLLIRIEVMRKMSYSFKIKLNGDCCLFFFLLFYLFVCRHSALPPWIDLCISRTSLSLPWRWVNKLKNNRRKHNRRGWQLRQVKWIYEWQKPGNHKSAFNSKEWYSDSSTQLVVLIRIRFVISRYTRWLPKTRPRLFCKVELNMIMSRSHKYFTEIYLLLVKTAEWSSTCADPVCVQL